MAKMQLERETKYKIYRTRKDISSCDELISSIITYIEVFYCIFRNAPNPIIVIKACNPDTKESLTFEISTRYQRQTISYIKRKYVQLTKCNAFLEDIENIYEITFIAKGLKSGKQTIYSNSHVPWHYAIFN